MEELSMHLVTVEVLRRLDTEIYFTVAEMEHTLIDLVELRAQHLLLLVL
jgi:hypothetical protein